MSASKKTMLSRRPSGDENTHTPSQLIIPHRQNIKSRRRIPSAWFLFPVCSLADSGKAFIIPLVQFELCRYLNGHLQIPVGQLFNTQPKNQMSHGLRSQHIMFNYWEEPPEMVMIWPESNQ